MGALGFGPELAPGRWAGAVRGFDFSGGAMPAGATLTRASPACWTDAAGVLRGAAADVARFDHDPVTHARRGLLIEPAATNLVTSSSVFTGPDWSSDYGGGSGAAVPTIAAAAVAAPDGTATASRIDFTRGDGYSRLSTTVATASGAYTFSMWLRAAAAPGISVALRLDSVNGETLTLDSTWRRFSMTADAQPTTMSAQLLLWTSIAGAPPTAAVDAWGAQVERGGGASSFIATAGEAATRAADRLTLDWGRFGVADGAVSLRCLFDDGTIEVIDGVVAGGATTLAPSPAPRWLRRVELA